MSILIISLHPLSHDDDDEAGQTKSLCSRSSPYQSQSEDSHQNKPCTPTYIYCMVRLYICAHQGLNNENVIQEEHTVCLHQPSPILKGVGENGKAFSE